MRNKKLNKVSNFVGSAVQYITVVIIVFLLFLSVIQVVLRTFNLPQMGIEELMQFPAIWMYMLGGVCASYTKNHIECGVLDSFIKNQRTLDLIGIIKTIMCIVICTVTIKWSYDFTLYCFKTNKISTILSIPWIIANLAVPVGLVLMEFFMIIELIERLSDFIFHNEKGES